MRWGAWEEGRPAGTAALPQLWAQPPRPTSEHNNPFHLCATAVTRHRCARRCRRRRLLTGVLWAAAGATLACVAAVVCARHGRTSRSVGLTHQTVGEQQHQAPVRQPAGHGHTTEPGTQARQSAACKAWQMEEAVKQRAREGAALTAVSIGLIWMLLKGLDD